jgi:predicted MFS family arabinose efflux permease
LDIGVVFVSSTLGIFFQASEFGAIPSLVDKDDLVTANGRVQASFAGASVFAPLVGGALLAFVPIEWLLYGDAATFLVSAGALALIAVPFNAPITRRATSIREDIVEGLRYVLRHPVLRNISLMMAMINIVQTTTFAQIVLFAKRELGATDSQVGIIFAAGGAGVFALGLAAGPLRKRWSFGNVALGALMLSGLLGIAFAYAPSYWVGVALFGLISGLGTLFNINTGSLRQAIVPNRMLGRVISIAMVLAWSANPIGAIGGGLLIERIGDVRLVYAIIGALTFLIAVTFRVASPLGHAERYIETERVTEKTGVVTV